MPEVARKHRTRYLALGLLVVIAVSTPWYLMSRPAKGSVSVQRTTTTAAVVRTDLVETASYDGTLSFANPRMLRASGSGVLTSLPAAGATIAQGRALYTVNEVPTFVMYGNVPMYRSLSAGVGPGSDVFQLETDLKALGYDPDGMVVDTSFDTATTDALNAWKTAVGLPADGTISPAQLQFSSGSVHVESLSATVGDRVADGTSLYTATDSSRVVTLALSTSDAALARKGDAVSVRLPSGSSVSGRITEVATTSSSGSGSGGAATGSTNQSGGSAATNSATVTVTITIDKPSAVADLDSAPVTVVLTQQRAANVLAVPVTALLALQGTGYAVEVVDSAGGTRLVAVTPGLYSADGFVEIRAASIAAGMRVTVPAAS